MSNFLAIASVTQLLHDTLDDALKRLGDDAIPGATVSCVRPDAQVPNVAESDPRINIYLYQVTPNAARCNDDLPTRDVDGRGRAAPTAALNLHYLISFFGQDADMIPQRLLGFTTAALHARAILSPQRFARSRDANGAPPYLKRSDMALEREGVHLTPLPLSLEELSRIWSVLFQTRYVLSIAYQASVVRITAATEVSAPLPVREARVFTLPFRRPTIERVTAAAGGTRWLDDERIIQSGDMLVLAGNDLPGEHVCVLVDDKPYDSVATTDARLETRLPESLPAGVHLVQVAHRLRFEPGAMQHRVFTSNVMPFLLHPTLAAHVNITHRYEVDGIGYCDAEVHLAFTPPVVEGQRAVLLLNELLPKPDQAYDVPRTALAYQFTVDVPALVPNTKAQSYRERTISIKKLVRGRYLARIQVDGAESPLKPTSDPDGWEPQVVLE